MQTKTQRLTKPTREVYREDVPDGLPTGTRANQRPHPFYIYVLYPKKWYWDSDGGWLPRPSKVMGVPGANGVHDPGYKDGRQRPVRLEHMQGTLHGFVQKGATIIHPQDERLKTGRDEEPWFSYNGYYETRDGGRWYVEPGQEATVAQDGTILWNGNTVGPVVRAFHLHLRDSGIAPEFLREYYEIKMGWEQEKLQNAIAAAAKTPGLGYLVERQQERIDRMTADYEAYAEGRAAPAPKKARRARKKVGDIAPAELGTS